MAAEKNSKYTVMKNTDLYSEKRTIRILLWIGIIGFLVSIALYIVSLTCSCLDSYLGYWNNVALGLSASSFITYFSLTFNYRNKVDEKKRELQTQILKIYNDYISLYSMVNSDSLIPFEPTKEAMDSYEKGMTGWFDRERKKYYLAQDIQKAINHFDNEYSISPVKSESVKDVIEMMKKKLIPEMKEVQAYCCAIVQQNTNLLNKPDDFDQGIIVDENNFETISAHDKKIFKTMILTAEWNGLVLESMENALAAKDFFEACKLCGIESMNHSFEMEKLHIVNNDLIDGLSNTIEAINENNTVRRNLGAFLSCTVLFSDDKYNKQYYDVSFKKMAVLKDIKRVFPSEDEYKKVSNEYRALSEKASNLLKRNRYVEADELVMAFAEKYELRVEEKEEEKAEE